MNVFGVNANSFHLDVGLMLVIIRACLYDVYTTLLRRLYDVDTTRHFCNNVQNANLFCRNVSFNVIFWQKWRFWHKMAERDGFDMGVYTKGDFCEL